MTVQLVYINMGAKDAPSRREEDHTTNRTSKVARHKYWFRCRYKYKKLLWTYITPTPEDANHSQVLLKRWEITLIGHGRRIRKTIDTVITKATKTSYNLYFAPFRKCCFILEVAKFLLFFFSLSTSFSLLNFFSCIHIFCLHFFICYLDFIYFSF